MLREFLDLDGPGAFKRIEEETILSLNPRNAVIATGGSVVYSESAMLHLRSLATVVFLDVPFEEIARRIGDISRRGVVIRPGMTLGDLFNERRPLYLRHADHVVDCAGKTQNAILDTLCTLFRPPKL